MYPRWLYTQYCSEPANGDPRQELKTTVLGGEQVLELPELEWKQFGMGQQVRS